MQLKTELLMLQGNFLKNLEVLWIKAPWEASNLHFCEDVCLLKDDRGCPLSMGKYDENLRDYLKQLQSDGGNLSCHICSNRNSKTPWQEPFAANWSIQNLGWIHCEWHELCTAQRALKLQEQFQVNSPNWKTIFLKEFIL